MKKIKYFFYLSLSFLLFSCYNAEQGKALATADSLLVIVQNIDKEYSSIDTENLNLIYDTIKTDIENIGQYMSVFPKNKEWKNAINIYADASKQAKHFFERDLRIEIDYSTQQLVDLKTDITNYAIETDSIASYLKGEKNGVSELKEKIDFHYQAYEQILDKYKRAKPFVDLYIDSLKNQTLDTIK